MVLQDYDRIFKMLDFKIYLELFKKKLIIQQKNYGKQK